MSQTVARPFRVHARHLDVHHARMLVEPSSEAAAMAYIETLHDLPEGDDGVRVIVLDLEKGQEQCFQVHLEDNSLSACG